LAGYKREDFGWYRVTFSFNSTGAPSTTPAPSPTGGGATPMTTEVQGNNFQWSPGSVTIKVGDSVRWSWKGSHNVAQSATDTNVEAKSGGFRSGPCCTADSEFTRTFDSPGVFHYICESHVLLGMRGTVTVEAK
jgi:plastocyanin